MQAIVTSAGHICRVHAPRAGAAFHRVKHFLVAQGAPSTVQMDSTDLRVKLEIWAGLGYGSVMSGPTQRRASLLASVRLMPQNCSPCTPYIFVPLQCNFTSYASLCAYISGMLSLQSPINFSRTSGLVLLLWTAFLVKGLQICDSNVASYWLFAVPV